MPHLKITIPPISAIVSIAIITDKTSPAWMLYFASLALVPQPPIKYYLQIECVSGEVLKHSIPKRDLKYYESLVKDIQFELFLLKYPPHTS